jgi:hypothetical protein
MSSRNLFCGLLSAGLILPLACGGRIRGDARAGDPSDGTDPTSAPGVATADGAARAGGYDSSCPWTCDADHFPTHGPWPCQLPQICDPVRFESASEINSVTVGPYTLVTPDAARCVLAALRDSSEGQVSWDVVVVGARYKRSNHSEISIRPRRVALSWTREMADFGDSDGYGQTGLRDPEYFTACLMKTNADAILECLNHAATGPCYF